jgi:hypothetical protein
VRPPPRKGENQIFVPGPSQPSFPVTHALGSAHALLSGDRTRRGRNAEVARCHRRRINLGEAIGRMHWCPSSPRRPRSRRFPNLIIWLHDAHGAARPSAVVSPCGPTPAGAARAARGVRSKLSPTKNARPQPNREVRFTRVCF